MPCMVCYPSLKASKVRNPLNGLTYPPSSCVSIFASKCVYVFPSSSFNFTYILHRNFCHVHLLELSARPVHFMFCFVLFCFVLFCFVLFCCLCVIIVIGRFVLVLLIVVFISILRCANRIDGSTCPCWLCGEKLVDGVSNPTANLPKLRPSFRKGSLWYVGWYCTAVIIVYDKRHPFYCVGE